MKYFKIISEIISLFFSSRGNYTLASSNNMYSKINSDRVKMIENATDDFLKNIYFFSVYHKYFPDCFTLSPELLLEKELLFIFAFLSTFL